MSAWSEFLVARIVVSSLGLYTLPLGLESLAGVFQTEWANYPPAACWCACGHGAVRDPEPLAGVGALLGGVKG